MTDDHKWISVFEDPVTYGFIRESFEKIKLKEMSFLELGPGKDLGAIKGIDDVYSKEKLRYTYSAVDKFINPEWEAIAKKHFGRNIERVVERKIPPIPFEDREFDCVVSIALGGTYCNHPEEMLSELNRIAKPKGYLLLYERNPSSLKSIAHHMEKYSFSLFKTFKRTFESEYKFILRKR